MRDKGLAEKGNAQSRITQEYGIGRIPNGSSPSSRSSGMVGIYVVLGLMAFSYNSSAAFGVFSTPNTIR